MLLKEWLLKVGCGGWICSTTSTKTVQFSTQRGDFPPNIDGLNIQQLVLYFVPADQAAFEMNVSNLVYTPVGASATALGPAQSINGVISTRRGNAQGNAPGWAASLASVSAGDPPTPAGQWQLVLPNTNDVKNHFQNQKIKDILFVITYAWHTPDWPGVPSTLPARLAAQAVVSEAPKGHRSTGIAA